MTPAPGDVFTTPQNDIRIISVLRSPIVEKADEGENQVEVMFFYSDDYYTIRGMEFSNETRWNFNTLTNKKPLKKLGEESVWGGHGLNQFLPYGKVENVR